MNIIVTGGAGFIGSHLIEKLVQEGHNVTSWDNYFTGKKENHISGCNYEELDTSWIIDSYTCMSYMDLSSIDIIYHFGEYSRVETSFEDRDLVWDYNIEGTKNIVEICVHNDIKLIYSASSTQFSEKGELLSPYSWSKYSNVNMIKGYGEWFGLDYAICYFYNVYGPRQIREGRYATVVGIFEKLYEENKPLTVVKPGTQKRNFTHISDIVNGLYKLKDYSGDGYCFGNEKEYSIIELAKMFKSHIKYLPSRKGNRMSSDLDLTKSKEIGWSAKINIEDYIDEFKKKSILHRDV